MSFPSVTDLIGVPFKDMGRDPAKGLDCWGLCMEVYRRLGIYVPDYGLNVPSAYASDGNDGQYREAEISGRWRRVMGTPAPGDVVADTPAPGDLVAMSTDGRMPRAINHFGVVIPGGRFIHVCLNHKTEAPKLHDPQWAPRMRGFWRWAG